MLLLSTAISTSSFAVDKSGNYKPQSFLGSQKAVLMPRSKLSSSRPRTVIKLTDARSTPFYGSGSRFIDTALNDKIGTDRISGSTQTRHKNKGYIYGKSNNFVTRDKIGERFVKKGKTSVGKDKKAKHISFPTNDSNTTKISRIEYERHNAKTRQEGKHAFKLEINNDKGTENGIKLYKNTRAKILLLPKQGKRVFVPKEDVSSQEKNAINVSEENNLKSLSSPYDMPIIGDSSEHGMLSRLLDQNGLGFGTNQEKQEKELTINEIEKYTEASSKLPVGFKVPTDGISPFSETSHLDVSVGTIPESDRAPQNLDSSDDYQKSSIPSSIKSHFLKKRMKKSSHHENRQIASRDRSRHAISHVRHNRFPKSYKREDISPYEKFSLYPKFPKISSAFPISKFSLAQHFPPFSGGETPKHFQRFTESQKNDDEDDEQDSYNAISQPPPLPPTLVSREHTIKPDDVLTDEVKPIDEPAPIREPAPIPEIAPIPELPPIKEIPPISENRESEPRPLDPKKTFEKAESNGGVKKSQNLRG